MSSLTFYRDERGATAPEYAMVLVVILALAMSIGSLAGSLNEKLSLADLTSRPGTDAQQDTVVQAVDTTLPSQTTGWMLIFAGSQALLAITAVGLLVFKAWRRDVVVPAVVSCSQETMNERLKAILQTLRHKGEAGQKWKPQVVHFMHSEPLTVLAKASYEEVKKEIESSVHHAVFVINDVDNVLGVIMHGDPQPGMNAASVMREVPFEFAKADNASSSILKMVQNHCTIAPVTQDGKLCGVLSYGEGMLGLVAALQLHQENEAKYREKLLNTLGPRDGNGYGTGVGMPPIRQ